MKWRAIFCFILAKYAIGRLRIHFFIWTYLHVKFFSQDHVLRYKEKVQIGKNCLTRNKEQKRPGFKSNKSNVQIKIPESSCVRNETTVFPEKSTP